MRVAIVTAGGSDVGAAAARRMPATIVFLASDGAAYITGQSLRVDGGMTRSV